MELTKSSSNPSLDYLSIVPGQLSWNLSPALLVEETLRLDQGKLAENGALIVKTGKFTGRSPKDRFIVKDQITSDVVDWGEINQPFESDKFDILYNEVTSYLEGKNLYARDGIACTDSKNHLNVRFVTENPWQNLFIHNMFIRPSAEQLDGFEPEWHVIAAPGYKANPEIHGTNNSNFSIINFSRKTIIIGGTAYTGEIKKGIFSVLNFILPVDRNILSMHCSANVGKNEDTAVFFGLSGTGKTTLSADPARQLIGDDEHGWSAEGVFNFEGGCYAKCIDLTQEKEPQIFEAIKFGTLLENVIFNEDNRKVDYSKTDITQNTRAAYPIYHIDNVYEKGTGSTPKNIFFLTCDAFGVLPPISKLTKAQAMYHFISGYTAKVAGTEEGITEPKTTFSACFGAPFLPLHPTYYAKMLGEKIEQNEVNVWLVNTGWTGGEFGVGERMSLTYTRAMITAALENKLDNAQYSEDPVFGLHYPVSCPGVPAEVLNPRNTWADKEAYDKKAGYLAKQFNRNFKQFETEANQEILSAAPQVEAKVLS